MKIKKAIISAAGYGTRFLPAVKAIPKELLPIIDKPIIQYLVEEAVGSGIEEVIIVTRQGLHGIEDHFDSNFELEEKLKTGGKTELLEKVQKPARLAHFIFLRQTKDYPYGNGSPLLVASNLIDRNESFVYMFGDDLVLSKIPATKQLIEVWQKNQDAIILGCQVVSKEEVTRYGMVAIKKGTTNQIASVIEKPELKNVTSRLVSFGRFILNRKIIGILEKKKLGKGGELWLQDANNEYCQKYKALAAKIKGQWLTTGDPLNYLKATVEYALKRKDLAQEFKNYLRLKLA